MHVVAAAPLLHSPLLLLDCITNLVAFCCSALLSPSVSLTLLCSSPGSISFSAVVVASPRKEKLEKKGCKPVVVFAWHPTGGLEISRIGLVSVSCCRRSNLPIFRKCRDEDMVVSARFSPEGSYGDMMVVLNAVSVGGKIRPWIEWD